jgi:hypothetical protein
MNRVRSELRAMTQVFDEPDVIALVLQGWFAAGDVIAA